MKCIKIWLQFKLYILIYNRMRKTQIPMLEVIVRYLFKQPGAMEHSLHVFYYVYKFVFKYNNIS